MSERQETIRDGLQIDFDLLDSDWLRCCIITDIAWNDSARPTLVWMEYTDRDHLGRSGG